MEGIRILSIEKFISAENQTHFYASDLKTHIKKNQSYITNPHKHDSYLCVLFTQGFGNHEIDFTKYEIKPGSIFMMAPGQTHHWNLSDDIDGFIFIHTQEFYNFHYTNERIAAFPFFQSIYNQPNLNLNSLDTEKMINLFENICYENDAELPLRNQMILNYISTIYSLLSRIYLLKNTGTLVKSSTYSDKYQQFEHLVEKHFRTEKSPSKYAELLHITAKHLNRVAKFNTNKTASDVISERIILEAKRKIAHSTTSLSEISLSLGFEDYAYFSRFFKQKEGVSPKEFSLKYKATLVK